MQGYFFLADNNLFTVSPICFNVNNCEKAPIPLQFTLLGVTSETVNVLHNRDNNDKELFLY